MRQPEYIKVHVFKRPSQSNKPGHNPWNYYCWYNELVHDERGVVRTKRREKTLGVSSKRKALELAEVIEQRLNGLLDGQPGPRIALEALADRDRRWMENRGRATGTRYLSGWALGRLSEALGGGVLYADDVGPEERERLIAALHVDGLKPKTINNCLDCLRGTWARAAKDGLLQQNPFAGGERLRVEEKELRPLTEAEEEKVLAAVAGDPELDLFTRLLLDSGARAGEVSHLLWRNISVENATAHVEARHTKTRHARLIAFSPETSERLRRWELVRKGKKRVFGQDGAEGRTHYRTMQRRFSKALERAQLGRRWSFHSFRGNLATLLARRGVNQKTVADILGHRDLRTTSRYYQGAADEETIRSAILQRRSEAG